MKKFAHIFVIVLVLFSVGVAESFPYTMQEVASAERCDDFRENEEFRISIASIKGSKVTLVRKQAGSVPSLSKSNRTICHQAQPISESLYLRLRILRI